MALRTFLGGWWWNNGKVTRQWRGAVKNQGHVVFKDCLLGTNDAFWLISHFLSEQCYIEISTSSLENVSASLLHINFTPLECSDQRVPDTLPLFCDFAGLCFGLCISFFLPNCGDALSAIKS